MVCFVGLSAVAGQSHDHCAWLPCVFCFCFLLILFFPHDFCFRSLLVNTLSKYLRTLLVLKGRVLYLFRFFRSSTSDLSTTKSIRRYTVCRF